MTIRVHRGALLAAVAAIVLAAGTAQSAQASETIPGVQGGGIESMSVTSSECVDALPAGVHAAVCTFSTTVTLGEPEVVTETMLRADLTMTAAERAEMLASVEAGTLATNHWSQFATGGVYTQTQNGRFYYDGTRAWVTQSHNGQTGSHACFSNYIAPGYGITNVSKSDSGGGTRTVFCGWNVVQLGGWQTYFDMNAQLAPNGTISGFGSSVG